MLHEACIQQTLVTFPAIYQHFASILVLDNLKKNVNSMIMCLYEKSLEIHFLIIKHI